MTKFCIGNASILDLPNFVIILKGNPTIIDNDKKVDIGHLFKQYYGEGYIGDSHIKMLSEKNEFILETF
ncbi:hypothetical protein QK911_01960 [Lactococcus lactis]